MRLIPTTILLLSAALAGVTALSAADAGRTPLVSEGTGRTAAGKAEIVNVRAILVIASDEGSTDASLAAYEANLTAMLRFKAYRQVGSGTTKVAVGKEGKVPLHGSQHLTVEIKNAWDNQFIAGLKWWNGDLNLANITVMRKRQSHTVMSGPAAPDGKSVFAVIVFLE